VRALDEFEGIGTAGAPTAERLSAIEAAIIARLRPVRPLAPAGVLVFESILTFAGVMAVGMIVGGKNHWSVLSAPERTAILAAGVVGALALSVSMIGQMAPGNKCASDSGGLVFAIPPALLLVIAFSFRPHPEMHFVANGLACRQRGLTVSLPAGFLLSVLLRR
jgi:hypothetical protein